MATIRSGFSLVEMLVAVILLTLLIGVAIFSFRHQLITINKTQKVGINRVITYNQLRSSLQSINHYVVDDYDQLGYPMKNLHSFFEGTKNEINYITDNPLFSQEIALVRLLCIDKQMTYQEQALYGTIDFLRPELSQESRKITMYKDLENCEFKYFVDGVEFENVMDKIPNAIAIDELHVNVKSDYNLSVGIIDDAIYAVE